MVIAMVELLAMAAAPRGTALVALLSCYSGARFVLELRLGDRRRYWWALSESQWLSLALVSAAGVLSTTQGHLSWLVLSSAGALGKPKE